MDYGKLAYLKTQELEQSINKKTQNENKILCKNLISNTFLEANEGHTIFNIDAKENLGIIVNLYLRGEEESKVSLFINGKKAQTQDYSPLLSFMITLNKSQNNQISIMCNKSLTILKADCMLIGEGEFLNSINRVCVDYSNQQIGIVSLYDNLIKLFILPIDSQKINLTDYILLGRGNCADVVSVNYDGTQCFAVCYIDQQKNVILNIVKRQQEIYELVDSICLFNNAQDISLSIDEQGDIIIGLIVDEYAYVNKVNPLSKTLGERVERGSKIDLIKKAVPPAVIINKDGKNIIKVSLKQLEFLNTIKLNLTII